MDEWTDGRTFETGFIRSTRRSRPKNRKVVIIHAQALQQFLSQNTNSLEELRKRYNIAQTIYYVIRQQIVELLDAIF